MVHLIENLLSPTEVTSIRETLEGQEFADGGVTAGAVARIVKHNTQVPRTAACAEDVTKIVYGVMQRSPQFQAVAYPRILHSLLVARYEPGMSYGPHIDDPLMSAQRVRADVSATLFLSDPSEYDGGELEVGTPYNQAFKGAAGSLVVYPSTSIHQVLPVTRGVRLVVVFWIESLIRDAANREILFDIDQTRRSLFARDGKSRECDLLMKTHANLIRRWVG